jgi:D-glycero-alpha-D-manno-heptose-7-phosphate kinase
MKILEIRSRAPLRIGIVGGGTDVSPFCDLHGGLILNATINLYAQCILQPNLDNSPVIQFNAPDIEKTERYQSFNEVCVGKELPLHSALIRHLINNYHIKITNGFSMTTYADAPVGSGLGTSSTLVVCMIEAYNRLFRMRLSRHQIARIAYDVERVDLGFKGGRQDQYAASFGGINCMEFGPGSRVSVKPLAVKKSFIRELEASTVLFYSGQSRDSAKIIDHQIKKASETGSESFKAMLALKGDTIKMIEAIKVGDLERYATILRESWENKKKLSNVVTNPILDEIYSEAISAGATAGKISGAGGGGFFMFYVNPRNRNSLLRSLSGFPGKQIGFGFTKTGVESWRS